MWRERSLEQPGLFLESSIWPHWLAYLEGAWWVTWPTQRSLQAACHQLGYNLTEPWAAVSPEKIGCSTGCSTVRYVLLYRRFTYKLMLIKNFDKRKHISKPVARIPRMMFSSETTVSCDMWFHFSVYSKEKGVKQQNSFHSCTAAVQLWHELKV